MSRTPRPTPVSAAARLPQALREFVRTEAAGGALLLVAAAAALIWANSPFQGSYHRVWEHELGDRLGPLFLPGDVHAWVNEGLMALFFFVVGLEIKRELVGGELRRWRTAALPAVAALGGMVVPALLYLAVNATGPGARGWGVPMATDIAFALGVVALLGPRVPGPLKLFLLTLAIVDDIGAILVIALFYSSGIEPVPLAGAAGLLVAMIGLRRAGARSLVPFVLLGAGVWLAVFQSGVHATLAGVVLGLLAPATDDRGDHSASPFGSVVERLEHTLHPWTSFAVIPLFALANAGVALDGDALSEAARSPVTAGVMAGLVVGKVVGISATSWLAVRLGLGALPTGVGWAQLVAVAAVAGIGFTVSLFIAEVAFADEALVAAAKTGVLVASVLAAVVGTVALLLTSHRPEPA